MLDHGGDSVFARWNDMSACLAIPSKYKFIQLYILLPTKGSVYVAIKWDELHTSHLHNSLRRDSHSPLELVWLLDRSTLRH